jgi:hypothetical protein
MIFKFKLLAFVLLLSCFSIHAQQTDTTAKINDTASVTTTPKSPKIKEVKKLDDPALALAPDLIYRLKQMKPNQLLVINERFVRNEKRVDESGEQYEVTVTVRLGFSQDMITGIIKEVPLYQSAEREMNLINVKIPVKFCCTTPIDTLHKKKHCGKMSELNDFEDNEHCKDWIQQDEAQVEAENAAGFGKVGGSKTSSKKKGATTTSKTNENGEGGFGKPAPKGKPTKKGKKGQVITEEENVSDSTGTAPKEAPVKVVPKGKSSKKEKYSKDEAPKKEDVIKDSTGAESKETPTNSKDKKSKKKNEKVEPEKKTEPATDEGFGKPQPKEKGKKKGKEVAKETPPVSDSTSVTTDSTNREPVKPVDKKTKKKKGLF